MVKTFRLPNGVTCVTDARPGSGKVSMIIQIKSGSMHERMEENGLTFLAQASCIGGTATRSRKQIAKTIESNGGEIETWTDRVSTVFHTDAAARHAKENLAVLADMVRNPTFKPGEIRKVKAQVEQALIQQDESPAARTDIKFHEMAFSGQAAGLNSAGSRELLASFTPSQIWQKYAEILAHPENIIISLSGDVSTAQAEKMVREHFGDMPKAEPAKQPQISFTGGDVREAADNEQINIKLGFKAPAFHDPDKSAVRMLQWLLDGGMSSPLFEEMREKRGLVYDVGASYAPYDTAGLFSIGAGGGKGNAGKIIAVVLDVLGNVIRKGVNQKALDQTRKSIISAIGESRETAEGSCASNAEHILYLGRTMSVEEWDEEFRQVTPDDIRRVCANMLRDGNYALAAVGPQETMPSPQKIKKMMLAQVEGVEIPPPKPAKKAFARSAGAKKKKKPPVRARESQVTVLENGMRVITTERPGNLSCGAWVGTGSDNEMPAQNGATHMLEHMPFKGTLSYGPGDIDRIIEKDLGGALNAYTYNDKTAYYFYRLKAEDLQQVIGICGEIVFKATLDPAEFDGKTITETDGSTVKANGERDVVIEELGIDNDDVGAQSWTVLLGAAYPDQPHGRPILGTEKTLRAMTIQQLAAYRDAFYVPNNVVFSAVGPVEHEDFVALIRRKYGHMPARPFAPLPAAAYQGGTAFIEYPKAALCDVKIAAEAVPTSDPDRLAYDALSRILGNGMSSRLYEEIVDKKEICADVSAQCMDFRNGGNLVVMGSMAADKVKPFVSAVYAEMRKLVDDVKPEELERVKISMEMAALSELEANKDACDKQACNTLAYGRPVSAAEMSAQIRKLTVGDIKRVAGKALGSNPTLGMVVPPGTDKRYLPKHEEVVAMRDGKTPPSAQRGYNP